MKEDSVRSKILQRAMIRSTKPLSVVPTTEESRSASPQELKSPIITKSRLESTISNQLLKYFKEVYDVFHMTAGVSSPLHNKSYAMQDLLEEVPCTHHYLYSETISLIQENSDLSHLEENLCKILAPVQTMEEIKDLIDQQADFRYNTVNAEPYRSICAAYFWLFIKPPAKKPSLPRATSLFLLQPPDTILENIQSVESVRETEELPIGIRKVLLEIPEKCPEPVKIICDFLLAVYSCKYEYMPEINLINQSLSEIDELQTHAHRHSANEVSPLKTLDEKTLNKHPLDKNKRILNIKGNNKEEEFVSPNKTDGKIWENELVIENTRQEGLDLESAGNFTSEHPYQNHSTQIDLQKDYSKQNLKNNFPRSEKNEECFETGHKIIDTRLPYHGSKKEFEATESLSELSSKIKFSSIEISRDISDLYSKKEDFSDFSSRKGDLLDSHSKMSSDNIARNENSSGFFNKESIDLSLKDLSFGDEPAPKIVETSLLSIIGVNKPSISIQFKHFIIRKLKENRKINLFPNKDKLIKEFSSELCRNDLKMIEPLKSDQKYRQIISEARKETGLAKSSPFEWRYSLIAKRRASVNKK